MAENKSIKEALDAISRPRQPKACPGRRSDAEETIKKSTNDAQTDDESISSVADEKATKLEDPAIKSTSKDQKGSNNHGNRKEEDNIRQSSKSTSLKRKQSRVESSPKQMERPQREKTQITNRATGHQM